MRQLMTIWFVVALSTGTADAAQTHAADEWRYVLPEPGAEHEYPPLRAIPLSNDKPEDVKEHVEYRGASRRYAQLRYGSPSAPRVAIVVDQVAPGEVDIYVDTNRDRTIAADERATGEGRLWRVPLDVQYARGDEFDVFPRRLIFRLGSTGRTLSYAAAGYLEGKLRVDAALPDKVAPALRDGNSAVAEGDRQSPPRSVGATVRRMDGDANGFFTDPQDRLWIDLNGDGRWDAVDEQFLYSPILTLGGQRYSVRSDERGNRLSLAKLEGTGIIQLAVHQKPAPDSSEPGVLGRVSEIAVTLVGRDGSAVGLRGASAEASVPIGDYRVNAVAVTLDDAAGAARWNFVFSDNQSGDAKRWHQLKKDDRLSIDPLEKFDFAAGPWQISGTCRPGDDLTFQPKLFTVDGLLINTCYRGTHDTGRDGTCASIKLTASDGTLLSTAQSGFA
jgi:hypothetical protein